MSNLPIKRTFNDHMVLIDCVLFLDKAPVITSGPEDVTGDLHETAIALGCEARGFPIPVLMWEFESATGKKIKLPGTSRLLNRSAGCVLFFFCFYCRDFVFVCWHCVDIYSKSRR